MIPPRPYRLERIDDTTWQVRRADGSRAGKLKLSDQKLTAIGNKFIQEAWDELKHLVETSISTRGTTQCKSQSA